MRTLIARTLDTLGTWMQQVADKVDPPKRCNCIKPVTQEMLDASRDSMRYASEQVARAAFANSLAKYPTIWRN